MAKRARASVRGKLASKKCIISPQKTACKTTPRKRARKIVRQQDITQISWRAKGPKRLLFTPGALAHARRRYEQTESSLEDIAIDLGVVRNTVRDIARREGWVRYVPPARGLTRTVLNTQANDLAAQMFATQRTLAQAGQSADDRNGSPNIDPSAAPPELTETVARLYRAVLEELAAAEALRAQLGSDPESPQHAERTARILSSLTETLQKLQRLQCAVPHSGSNDDDIPACIDEFRTELARRIEAFVASRSEPGAACGPVAASVDAAAG